mgnify:CR=1 FL=1
MSFRTAISGIRAATADLTTIGNNVANANTYGTKASRAEFADMYAGALAKNPNIRDTIRTYID